MRLRRHLLLVLLVARKLQRASAPPPAAISYFFGKFGLGGISGEQNLLLSVLLRLLNSCKKTRLMHALLVAWALQRATGMPPAAMSYFFGMFGLGGVLGERNPWYYVSVCKKCSAFMVWSTKILRQSSIWLSLTAFLLVLLVARALQQASGAPPAAISYWLCKGGLGDSSARVAHSAFDALPSNYL